MKTSGISGLLPIVLLSAVSGFLVRSYVLNEAVENYLDVRHWQIEHIKKGLRQAEQGHFAKDKDVKAAFAKWRK